jgi:hypothetical protein
VRRAVGGDQKVPGAYVLPEGTTLADLQKVHEELLGPDLLESFRVKESAGEETPQEEE